MSSVNFVKRKSLGNLTPNRKAKSLKFDVATQVFRLTDCY